eukprot:6175104-Pleurochrysis_carterae.AAC.2
MPWLLHMKANGTTRSGRETTLRNTLADKRSAQKQMQPDAGLPFSSLCRTCVEMPSARLEEEVSDADDGDDPHANLPHGEVSQSSVDLSVAGRVGIGH